MTGPWEFVAVVATLLVAAAIVGVAVRRGAGGGPPEIDATDNPTDAE